MVHAREILKLEHAGPQDRGNREKKGEFGGFAWIDTTERGRIQREIASLEEILRSLGRLERLVTRAPLAVQGETV